MKWNELKELIEILDHSSLDVLKIENQDIKLYFQKHDAATIDFTKQQTETLESVTVNLESEKTAPKREEGLHQIKSPMIGAFYSRSNPETAPFVQVGTVIEKNQTLCVLEAMKLFNEVVSDVGGEIVDILVEDGQIIEFGQPLFLVKVGG
ncbi:acetyl-CoA carboxylase biotin carboxyl carrier protein [Bacillus salipaludis]|uniref:Biotin carboxyl carrier protein of acetyl-CoA carboxylase n=1 Tax=Bacillus salipaludis TaxID=2547811 RepID=A0AA90TUN1_9BACI|nr:acetyl-CoA carboxylase biotin carboxyl carrier protein [Bacillus salipaludis]MDQ6600404.1 acetyl-CoA carboxylase biotin carboxyl carrier protein [Bacillus salipaludis]